MTAAQDLATAKTQADTAKTATATLVTNLVTALASQRAASPGVGDNFALSALALAREADRMVGKVVWLSDASRAAASV